MRPDGAFRPPRAGDPRHTPISAALAADFIAACLCLWRAGHDTATIAALLRDREAAVAAAVRIGRELWRTAKGENSHGSSA